MEYKGYKIETDGMFGLFTVKLIGKGSAPKELRGTYTSKAFAMSAIDDHKASKGVETNGDERNSD